MAFKNWLYRWTMRAIGVYAALFVVVAAYSYLLPVKPKHEIAPADVILVLGGGVDRLGAINHSTENRIAKGIELYKEGLAPTILFSGHLSKGKTFAKRAEEVALNAGISKDAILSEGQSRSTLQNMLFSQDLMGGGKKIILVTSEFHMPRSAISAYLNGFGWPEIAKSQSGGGSLRLQLEKLIFIAREPLAFGLNAIRFPIWKLAELLGFTREERDWLLI